MHPLRWHNPQVFGVGLQFHKHAVLTTREEKTLWWKQEERYYATTFITADIKTFIQNTRDPGKVSKNKQQSHLELTEEAEDQGSMAWKTEGIRITK